MDFYQIITCALLGLYVTGLLIPRIVALSRKRLAVESIREFHHTHKAPVSRFGGLALAAAFVAIAGAAILFSPLEKVPLFPCLVIVVSSLAAFGLGFWDDLRPLGAKKKLAGQILIALAVYACGIQIETVKNPLTGTEYSLGFVGMLATVFWLVALTNLINLIDGIDGLAGGIGFMLMCLLAYVSYGNGTVPFLISVGMAGALLSFLYFNFPPAKIYLGDGGAYFIGFLIGILSLVNSQKGTIAAALIAPIFALAIPIIDVSLAILRRGLKGLPVFRADRKHIHHRLVDGGFSRKRTVLTLYAISLIFLVLAFAAFWSRGHLVPLLFGVMCLVLIGAGGALGFSRDWLAIGRVVGNSLQMRKQTRYALLLGSWLELDADRCDSFEDLWESFRFMVRKTGFSQVKLALKDAEEVWQRDPVLKPVAPGHYTRHEFHAHNAMTLEFTAEQEEMSEKLFKHLAELAAESWLKATTRWQQVTELPLCFKSELPADTAASSTETPDLALPMRASSLRAGAT